jgi:hypothetical protein
MPLDNTNRLFASLLFPISPKAATKLATRVTDTSETEANPFPTEIPEG